MIGWIIFWIVVAISVIELAFLGLNIYFTFRRYEQPRNNKHIVYEDVADEYPREEVRFASHGYELQGYLYGKGNTRGTIVVSHGIWAGAVGYLPDELYFADQGFQVFAFDYRGYCGSQGKSSRGLHQSLIDLDAALSYVEASGISGGEPVFLYGHSWGGYTVASMIGSRHPIAGVISISGFNRPLDVTISWGVKMVGLLGYSEYPYAALIQFLTFGKDWNHSAVSSINSAETPILIVHGDGDDVVDYEGISIISHRDKITNPKAKFIIRDKDHRRNHTELYLSLESALYIEEINQGLEDLKEKYGKKIPTEVENAFYDAIDRKRSSLLDDDFMQEFVAFYDGCRK